MTDVEQLYSEYFKDVYLFVLALSSDATVAEDVTADTFLKAMSAAEGFRGDCDVRVWLCQIAKNAYFSYLRKNRRTTELDELEAAPVSVESAVLDADESMRVHAALHDMEEPYKEVFTLRVFGELSFRQIGRLFGKTDNWACVTYHRAKTKLKERMEE